MPELEPAEWAVSHVTFSPKKSSHSQSEEEEESRRPENTLEGQVVPPLLLCDLVFFFWWKPDQREPLSFCLSHSGWTMQRLCSLCRSLCWLRAATGRRMSPLSYLGRFFYFSECRECKRSPSLFVNRLSWRILPPSYVAVCSATQILVWKKKKKLRPLVQLDYSSKDKEIQLLRCP